MTFKVYHAPGFRITFRITFLSRGVYKAIPDYQKTDGFVKLTFLRNTNKNIGHFTLITFWKNIEVIKNFAGEDFEKAKYYPEDEKFLLEFEEKVTHYEVFADE